MALDTGFARDLDRIGFATGPNGADYKMVTYDGPNGPNSLAFERVRDGHRDTIVGFRCEPFASRAAVIDYCDQDSRN